MADAGSGRSNRVRGNVAAGAPRAASNSPSEEVPDEAGTPASINSTGVPSNALAIGPCRSSAVDKPTRMPSAGAGSARISETAGGTGLADRVAAEVPRLCLARPTLARPIVLPTAVLGEPVLPGAMQAALAQARAGLLGSLSTATD